jgi:hypothetical protein
MVASTGVCGATMGNGPPGIGLRTSVSPSGTNRLAAGGQSCPLCPANSDINLFCYCQRVINLNPEIPDGALDFRVAEQELNGSKIASAPKGRLVRRSEWVP